MISIENPYFILNYIYEILDDLEWETDGYDILKVPESHFEDEELNLFFDEIEGTLDVCFLPEHDSIPHLHIELLFDILEEDGETYYHFLEAIIRSW